MITEKQFIKLKVGTTLWVDCFQSSYIGPATVHKEYVVNDWNWMIRYHLPLYVDGIGSISPLIRLEEIKYVIE